MIYVGKAVSLRDRVRSYFQQQGRFVSPKVKAMVENIADLEYIVTDSEVEALILEATLIKEKEPRYNVRLKDDKAYPYLKVTNEPFPRVMVVRRPGKDGRTFGPYANPRAVRETLAFLRKLFPIRTCSLDLSGELYYRPCLLYHIGRCGAPCAGTAVRRGVRQTHRRSLPLPRRSTPAPYSGSQEEDGGGRGQARV